MHLHKTIPKILMLALWLTMTSLAYAAKYTYDDLNRLIQVAYDSGQIVNYSYDAGGNMLMVKNEMPVIDTDGDGISDDVDTDDDNDGMPDIYEEQYPFLNPLEPSDASADEDGDGKSNLEEYQQGTEPNVSENAQVRLVMNTSPSLIQVGETFDVTFRILQDGQKVDAEHLGVLFDNQKLHANSVTNSGALDFVLTSDINNAEGFVTFAVGNFMNTLPTGDFDLFTINFTAKEATDSTILRYDPIQQCRGTYAGEYIQQTCEEMTLVIQEPSLACQVDLQGRPPAPDVRWETALKLSGAISQEVMTDNAGSCKFEALPNGEHTICVKNAHTLQNKVNVSLPLADNNQAIDFGLLLEGDISDDNVVELTDFSLMSSSKGKCQGEAGFNANADLNVDACVNTDDAKLLQGNYMKVGQICNSVKSSKVLRKRSTRDSQNSQEGTVILRTSPIPTSVKPGSTFEFAIEVSTETGIDAVATYLNYSPSQIKVNSLQAGSRFDFILQNEFDNTVGHINFAAGIWENELPSGKITLVTINATLLETGAESSFSFNTEFPRATKAAFQGQTVLESNQDGKIGEIVTKNVGIYGVKITVMDELKVPISGVLLQVGDKSVISNETGYGEIVELVEGKYTLTASKEGLSFQAQSFEVGNQQLWTPLVVTPLTELDAKITPVVRKKAEQGKPFSYLITVINGGSETATGVSFSYQLPTGTEVVEIRGVDSQACEPVTADQILACQLPTLVSGETTQVEVELDVKQPNSTLVNTVHLVANEYPSVKTEVRTLVKPYLSVFCQATPNPITMGGVLHYECEVELNDNAPTGVATQITLEMQVPNGVELSSLKTDDGVCDSREFPQITCQIDDLTIKNPGDTSHITLYMDVTLTDMGLLALTNQATIKAHGYVAHTSRERTKIFIPPEYKVDMVLVIDVTHSMQEEMNGVKQALVEFSEEFDPSMFPLTALIVFRDEVIVKAVTTDMDLLADAIGKMEASEGGTCPEASIEALNIAIAHVKDGGIIVLATDASPYPEADIEATTQRLREKNVSLHVQWSGDCSNKNDQNDWDTLPTAD